MKSSCRKRVSLSRLMFALYSVSFVQLLPLAGYSVDIVGRNTVRAKRCRGEIPLLDNDADTWKPVAVLCRKATVLNVNSALFHCANCLYESNLWLLRMHNIRLQNGTHNWWSRMRVPGLRHNVRRCLTLMRLWERQTVVLPRGALLIEASLKAVMRDELWRHLTEPC